MAITISDTSTFDTSVFASSDRPPGGDAVIWQVVQNEDLTIFEEVGIYIGGGLKAAPFWVMDRVEKSFATSPFFSVGADFRPIQRTLQSAGVAERTEGMTY